MKKVKLKVRTYDVVALDGAEAPGAREDVEDRQGRGVGLV